MKDSPKTSESHNIEALAADDNFEAELDNIRNMTPEEANAVEHKEVEKCVVAVLESNDAARKTKMAVRHLRAIKEYCENNARTESEKMYSFEAAEVVVANYYASSRVMDASLLTVVKAKRRIEAIHNAREKRLMTDGKSGSASGSN